MQRALYSTSKWTETLATHKRTRHAADTCTCIGFWSGTDVSGDESPFAKASDTTGEKTDCCHAAQDGGFCESRQQRTNSPVATQIAMASAGHAATGASPMTTKPRAY
eukprot:6212471-Pleurochrysis_carterae.AAC.5